MNSSTFNTNKLRDLKKRKTRRIEILYSTLFCWSPSKVNKQIVSYNKQNNLFIKEQSHNEYDIDNGKVKENDNFNVKKYRKYEIY